MNASLYANISKLFATTRRSFKSEEFISFLPHKDQAATEVKSLTLIDARSFTKRLIGLLQESNPCFDYALYLPRCSCIHSFGMRFSFAALFIDDTYRIQKVAIVKPWSYIREPKHTAGVIELSCNNACLCNTETLIGSRVLFKRAHEHAP